MPQTPACFTSSRCALAIRSTAASGGTCASASPELGASSRVCAGPSRSVTSTISSTRSPIPSSAARPSSRSGRSPTPSAARPVERLLQARDWRVRADAAGARPHPAIPARSPRSSSSRASDESAFVRFDAVAALHEFDDPLAVDALAAALEDESASFRRWAAAELAERGDPRGTAELRAQQNPLEAADARSRPLGREPQVTLPLRIAVPLAAAWSMRIVIGVRGAARRSAGLRSCGASRWSTIAALDEGVPREWTARLGVVTLIGMASVYRARRSLPVGRCADGRRRPHEARPARPAAGARCARLAGVTSASIRRSGLL